MHKSKWSRRPEKYLPYIITIILVCIAGCDASPETGRLQDNTLTIGIPDKIRRVSEVNLNAVTAIANVTFDNAASGQDYVMDRFGEQFRTTISLNNVSSVAVNLRFSEQLVSGEIIDLASHPQKSTVIGDGNNIIEFSESDFTIDFDDDGDGITNLQERNLGTDPTVADEFRERRTISVSFIIPGEIPFPAITQRRVLIANSPRPIGLPDGFVFTSSGTVFTPDAVIVEVDLLQQLTPPQSVLLARSSTEIPIGFNDVSIQLNDNDFDYSFDDDGDGRTNIEEIRNGTNPVARD